MWWLIEMRPISYLAALVLSGHIIQHCSIINEGIQFPAGKKESGKITTRKWKALTWS